MSVEENELGHCWHHSEMQHAMIGHMDEFCCFCKVPRCVSFGHTAREGHGPFAPRVSVRQPHPLDKEECHARATAHTSQPAGTEPQPDQQQ
jgi:hypothetical protein